MDHHEMAEAHRRATDVGHTHDHDHDHDHDHAHDPSSNVNIEIPDIINWLASKRSTLWSTWAIDDDAGKEQAAKWFYREIESLIHHAITSRITNTTSV